MKRLELDGICFSFGNLSVLEGITYSFPLSSVTAILGPSGCGKTTLLNIIAGILTPTTGKVEGFDSCRFSYCFQEPRLLPWLSAIENLRFALSGLDDKNMVQARISRFMESAGLARYSHSMPRELSGGMKRRLALVRAFCYPSDILLLDESFASVDLKLRIELMDLFSTLWEEERRTTIVVSHDIQDVLYLADSVLVLSSRPATILDRIQLSTERTKRVYASRDALDQEERIYSLVLS
jgi:NitT/TauT family transport system ATP-binding protein